MELVGALVSGWKSLPSPEQTYVPLQGLVALIGPNGAGKTNLLEALAVHDPEARSLMHRVGTPLPAPPDAFVAYVVRFRWQPREGGPDAAVLDELLTLPWTTGAVDILFQDEILDAEWWWQFDSEYLLARLPTKANQAVGLFAGGMLAGLQDEALDKGKGLLRALLVDPVLLIDPSGSVGLGVLTDDPRFEDFVTRAHELLPQLSSDVTATPLTDLCARLLDPAREAVMRLATLMPAPWGVPPRPNAEHRDVDEFGLWVRQWIEAGFWWTTEQFGRPLVVSADVPTAESELAKGVTHVHDRIWHEPTGSYLDHDEKYTEILTLPDCVLCVDQVSHGGYEDTAELPPEERAARQPQGHPWLEGKEGWARAKPTLGPALQFIEDAANELAPSFVQEAGRIILSIDPVGAWRLDDPPCRISFEALGGQSRVELTALGAGVQRWVATAVRLASRTLANASRTVLGPSGEEIEDARDLHNELNSLSQVPEEVASRIVLHPVVTPTWILIDEPEQHLHPLAQDSVADWCVKLARSNHAVVVTTHSASFLQLPTGSATLRLVELADGRTTVEPMPSVFSRSSDRLISSRLLGDRLGIGRNALLQLTRGVFLVEGYWDRRVIQRCFGRELEEARALVLEVHGVEEAKLQDLAQLELFPALGVPVAVMFDNVQLARLREGPDEDFSKEERAIRKIMDASREVFHVIEYRWPDIICALPMAAVRRAFPHARTCEWQDIIREWEADPKPQNFKRFAFSRLLLTRSERQQTRFINAVLEAMTKEDALDGELHRAVQAALARFEAGAL